MDYGCSPMGGAWGPFLCGFLLAGLLALLPISVLTCLWLRAEARSLLSRLEAFLEDGEEGA